MGIALLAMVVHWRILPVGGMHSADSDSLSSWLRCKDTFQRLLLPATVLVLGESCAIIRHVRASVVEVLQTPPIEAARAFGISNARLLFRHVLPIAASPATSLFGFSLAGLISGSLLVEVICGWPGLGPLILEATLSRDFYLVIGGIMLSGLFMVAGNLVADVMLLATDPRIRLREADAA
jgi:peptide/nickel transport system permease protein